MLAILLFIFLSVAQPLPIPLKKDSWHSLKYSGIAQNKVDFADNKMTINVDKSAGPLVFRMAKPTRVSKIVVNAEFTGRLRLKDKIQGDEGADDFIFRLGLVEQGESTLNFFQRQIAPDWLVQLFRLAPEGLGIKQVQFFNTYSDPRLKGKRRMHPKSDLLVENFATADRQGKSQMVFHYRGQAPILALWVGCDGDDTKSQFTAIVEKITVHGFD